MANEKKSTFSVAQKAKAVRIKANVIDRMCSVLADMVKDATQEYRRIGESTEQDKDWKTGELLWDDEEKTVPRMKSLWGYVDKEELSEEDKLTVEICNEIVQKLVDGI